MSRFEAHWRRWDDAVSRGEVSVDLLQQLTDDDLVEMLAGGDRSRHYVMDLVATEILNRLARRQAAAQSTSAAAGVAVEEAHESYASSAGAVDAAQHAAEDLGPAPSAEALDHLTSLSHAGCKSMQDLGDRMDRVTEAMDDVADAAARGSKQARHPHRGLDR